MPGGWPPALRGEPGDLGCGSPPLPPADIALLPAETEEKTGKSPDLGSALGRGDASAARESETGLRGAPAEGAISGPGSWLGSCGNVEIVNKGGTQREPNKFVYFCKTLKGEPRLGTEKAGILRGAQKAARNRTSSRTELMNPA
ncbi:hypothetical protein NDU88_002666 [Pleurodeles waltl]|uniref:Uncharacterized protein n=1 Tax=Pleurodeles waltl TaxID=8319 RepID=A0AAV7M6N4_PLEWA|nr:hypothetical protein NDU88_002666 [Pleurodeles waltl]